MLIELLLIGDVFGLALWLGASLWQRDPRKGWLRWTGCGLLAYAVALACEWLGVHSQLWSGIVALQPALRGAPALLWALALVDLLVDREVLSRAAARGWRLSVGGAAALLVLAASTDLPAWAGLVRVALVSGPLGLLLALVWRHVRALRLRRPRVLLLLGGIMLLLGTAMLLAPLPGISPLVLVLGAGVDLALIGYGIAGLDAFDEGATLRPAMLRSLLAASSATLVVLVQFGAVALLAPELPLGGLMFSVIATVVLMTTLSAPLQQMFDRLTLRPEVAAQRAELRAAEAALPNLSPEAPALLEDSDEFARLTRRALSHYGDLARLAASPLTALPQIERLAQQPGDQLERAALLKALLAERVERLRPRGERAFGTSDEWRFYNALYFPYIVGLRPYRRRADYNISVDAVEQEALDWFRTYVPERTLYNWQQAAARLIAQDLHQEMQAALEQAAGLA